MIPALSRTLGRYNQYGSRHPEAMVEVITAGEAREAPNRIAEAFDSGEGKPVYFGSHRRPATLATTPGLIGCTRARSCR